jgi:hypothetical protein
LTKLAVAAALAWGAATAKAALHFDIDYINSIVSSGTPYEGDFDITGPGLGKGYDSSTMQIHWAYATFAFWDPILGGGSESLTVELGGEPFSSVGPFLGLILLGDQVWGDVLLDLETDGSLSYSVNPASGSFKLLAAELHAKSKPRPWEVPDSGWSLALLGMSMIGLASFRRK